MRLSAPLIAALATFAATAALAAPPARAVAELKAADGSVVGRASLVEGSSGVMIEVSAWKLAPGWHGMHFHEKGDCSDPKFMSAGGHMHMDDVKPPHGLLSEGGPDNGDLPNLYVAENGTAKAQVFTTRVSIHGAPGRPALLGLTGSALVIHADIDDETSQPIGGAGARIACGVIK